MIEYREDDLFLTQTGHIRKVYLYVIFDKFIYSEVKGILETYDVETITRVKLFADNKLNRKLYKDRIIKEDNGKIIVRL